jgi:hypothetical protein
MPDRHRTHDGALGAVMQPPEDLSARVEARLARELGEPSCSPRLLLSPWSSRATWAVSMPSLGELAVKVRKGDRASEKARWCELDLPLLAARGYPVPSIVWHGSLDEEWHVVVQRRLPGRSLRSLAWPLLDQVVGLVELQAMADALPYVGRPRFRQLHHIC